MNSWPISRALTGFLVAGILAAGFGQGRAAVAQGAQPAPAAAVAEVRQMVADARKDIESFTTGGGVAGAADHPAVKWNAALWQVHDRAPNSEAGTLAAVEAIRLLIRAELWDRAHARVESLDADDKAWERVPSAVYDEGIARKSFDYTVATLSRTAAATKTPSIKSAALLVIGRVHRRQGDLPAATRALRRGARRRTRHAAGRGSRRPHLRGRASERRPARTRDLREAAERPARDHARLVPRQGGRPRLLGQYLNGLHGGGSSTQSAPHEVLGRRGHSRHQRRHQPRSCRPHREVEGDDLAAARGRQGIRRCHSEGVSHPGHAGVVRPGSRRPDFRQAGFREAARGTAPGSSQSLIADPQAPDPGSGFICPPAPT